MKTVSLRDREAMTLVELIVVIAILALLAALLLPVLAGSKSRAQNAVCLNNLKQWAVAMQLYLEDHDDFIPRESAYSPGTILNSWTDVQSAKTRDVWYNALPPLMTKPTASNYYHMPASFYDRSCLFQCPSAKIANDYYYALFSLSMNSKLIKLGLRLNFDDLCKPASTVMFLDNLLDGEETAVPGLIPPRLGQPSSYANRFSPRHNRRGNIIFWDGHAESLAANEVVETKPGPNLGRAIEPQSRVVWDPCPTEY